MFAIFSAQFICHLLTHLQVARYWQAGEKRQGVSGEGCGVAHHLDGALTWTSNVCTEERPFMCMGQSGVVMSDECKKFL